MMNFKKVFKFTDSFCLMLCKRPSFLVMFRLFHHYEILKSIVSSYAIKVMDMLRFFKSSSKNLFHHNPMLSSSNSIYCEIDVPISDRPSTFPVYAFRSGRCFVVSGFSHLKSITDAKISYCVLCERLKKILDCVARKFVFDVVKFQIFLGRPKTTMLKNVNPLPESPSQMDCFPRSKFSCLWETAKFFSKLDQFYNQIRGAIFFRAFVNHRSILTWRPTQIQ